MRNGDWSAVVLPALGGSILSLEYAGRPIFRPTPAGADDILQTACFPLVPYANRIADGVFTFGGHQVVLPVLDRFAPHALHGDGWLRPWTVDAADAASVTLRLSGGGDHWPWPWTAVQTIALSVDGLSVTLSIVNEAEETAPAGLGLHPYFHRAPDTRLTLAADGVWLTDAREIPDRLAGPAELADWSGGLALADAPFVDHAYAGWDRQAVIQGDGRTVVMRASEPCHWAQVYAPSGEAFLCVEPVTHRPDDIHAPPGEATGLTVLAPGESLSMRMTVSIAG
ncbi:aldose 1-epimerase [Rhizobium sp. CRIBSB]|nr:aldose 1-epimerase [Rhizobium sp. CRIBSB]